MEQKFISKEAVISKLEELDKELEQLEKELHVSLQQLKQEWLFEQEALLEQCNKRLDAVQNDYENRMNQKLQQRQVKIQYGMTI